MKTEYEKFLESKKKTFIDSGFDASNLQLNHLLKDFQEYGIKTALKKGRFAFFFDCGLGKTFCMLEWSRLVSEKTGGKVLILAPLAIVEQTKREAKKFGISVDIFDITNYDQLKNVDTTQYVGIVLDESSILKGRDGNDEKHITPLQLDTIERILHLYSNEGDVVFSPFGGIGSEGFQALKMGRKSISIELKDSYFNLNVKNHRDVVLEMNSTLTLF